MDSTLTTGIIISVLVLSIGVYTSMYSDDSFNKGINANKNKPKLWVYLNSSDVNSRSWSDFMSRSSHAINLPYLNLCYETIVAKNSDIYDVEVIGGLQDLAVRMGGWESLPSPLRNTDVVVREPELNWIRAAVLNKWGGLWVCPSVICLKGFGALPKKRVVFFGADTDPTYSSSKNLPSLNACWSPAPNHRLWVSWEKKVRDRLERRSGGSEFRHDEKSDLLDAINEFKNEYVHIESAELSRKGAALKRIELEDLLSAGTEGELPFTVYSNNVYVPIPYPEILQRRAFEWFLRMSEAQIMESDLVVTYLFNLAK